MKKLLIPIITLLAVVSIGNAFGQSKQELRKERREQKQQEFMQQLDNALKQGKFTFIAQTFQSNIGNPVNVNLPNNFLSLYGDVIDVQLPYYSFSPLPSPRVIDFIDAPISYKVSSDGTNYYVTIEINNAVMGGRTFITQNGNYNFHLTINARNGYAMLTITPQLSSSATYTGVIQLN